MPPEVVAGPARESIWLPGAAIRIHGLDWGPPDADGLVLLLHGVGGNARIWDAAAPRLVERLGGSHQVVALDGRDGGLTDHPPTGYRAADFAADLLAVHDALGRRPLTLVGHSRSGWLATWLTERHPDRVERLVLVDPARLCFASGESAERFYTWVRGALGPFASREAALGWARGEDPHADWNEVRSNAFLAGLMEQPDGSLTGRLPVEAVDELRAARDREDVVSPLLSTVRCPVLLLVGRRQSDERIADKLAYAAGLPTVRVEFLDGTHFLHTDCPDRVAELIADFIASA